MDSTTSGKELRQILPRSMHAEFEPHDNRPSVVEFLQKSSEGRVEDLIPVRYFRMSGSPFTFYRGAANIMAYDLASAGCTTGLTAQLGGDAHVSNFGLFATPERNIIFDVNDFDETLPGPWEWDVKRLAASVHIAARTNGRNEKRASAAVRMAVAAYREQMQRLSTLTALQLWYTRIDAEAIDDLRLASDAHHVNAHEMTVVQNGHLRFIDKAPKIFHDPSRESSVEAEAIAKHYKESLRDDIALLFGRYTLTDIAVKVVGVGSVGTRCSIALFTAGPGDNLILQVKEAVASVLEEYLEPSIYPEHGQRVVAGQRLMQSVSDIFLGWTKSQDGHDYYVRQLNDMKTAIDVSTLDDAQLGRYAGFCGQAIALAHARSGNPAAIAEYLGASTRFDDAIAEFASKYADQNDRDYAAFKEAIKSGILPTKEG